jgi:hypothetical protein
MGCFLEQPEAFSVWTESAQGDFSPQSVLDRNTRPFSNCVTWNFDVTPCPTTGCIPMAHLGNGHRSTPFRLPDLRTIEFTPCLFWHDLADWAS